MSCTGRLWARWGATLPLGVDAKPPLASAHDHYLPPPVKILRFGRGVAAASTRFGSEGALVSPVARTEGRVLVSALHLDRGGRLGRHEAVVNRLLLVVAGGGWVAGGDGVQMAIEPGRAAFWEAGEEHECGTDTGLIAVIVESRDLSSELMSPT